MSKSKPFHGTITLIISAWLLGFFCRGYDLQKNIRQHLQHFPPLQRLSCVSCRALRKRPFLSVCLVYYSFIRSHSQALQLSFVYLAPLTFSFLIWNCPFCIFTPRWNYTYICYCTYIWITIYKDTFLLYSIFITALGIQISLLGGTGFVQLARSVLTGEWEMFSSAVDVCWMLFLKSQCRHRGQGLPPITTVNIEAATIIWPYLYRIKDICVSLQDFKDKLQFYISHSPRRTKGGKGWS